MSGEAEKTERAYVYMVRCAGGQLYTGWTNDPASRLHAHKSGKGAKCTRALGAQRFAYLERCTDKSAALRREAALKKLTKAQKEALCAEWAEKNLPRLSLATRADAAEILDIYNWYVLHHTATFQVTPSSLPEYEDWVDSTRALIPLLLARDGDGKLLGYACAHRYHPREAYDWGLLGWYVGKRVGAQIPVFRFRNLEGRPSPEALLYLGAELNTSGAVPMYHILGVTPEAPDEAAAFGGRKPSGSLSVTDRNLEEQEAELSERGGRINLVMLGCPHYSYAQIRELDRLLAGRTVSVPFWVLTSGDAMELARRSGELERIEASGARLVPDTCIDEPCWKSFEGGLGVTDSPKCMYYRERRGQPFVIRRLGECVEAAVKGEI